MAAANPSSSTISAEHNIFPAATCSAMTCVALGACTRASLSTISDQYGRQVTIVDTGIDAAGGERLTTIGQFDANGWYHIYAASQGLGTLQMAMPAAIVGASFVGGMAVLRPPRFSETSENNTMVESRSNSSSVAIQARDLAQPP
jgi:hypothetical protein